MTGDPTTGTTGTGKRVDFLELFFDLVFVFAVTQLVTLLHGDHRATGWLHAALALWLVWWAWSQFAWAGNAIDLSRTPVRLTVLAVTMTMLCSAAALPDAFGDDGAWFTLPYVAVRLAGLALYWFGLAGQPQHRAALRTYLPIALVSPVLVAIGGLLDVDGRVALWCLAAVVDVASVAAAGRGEFRVEPHHFAERHGLIVIIALGESVIAIGATAADAGLTGSVVAVALASFAAVAALWWCYFDRLHAVLERRLVAEVDHRRRGHLARDVFTLLHLPIVAGVVLFAAAAEEAVVHPADEPDAFTLVALAAGVSLFLAGTGLARWRSTGRLPTIRAVALVTVVATVLLSRDVAATLVVALVAAQLVAVAATEERQPARS
jgi:low temperature requirement protein LtrA